MKESRSWVSRLLDDLAQCTGGIQPQHLGVLPQCGTPAFLTSPVSLQPPNTLEIFHDLQRHQRRTRWAQEYNPQVELEPTPSTRWSWEYRP